MIYEVAALTGLRLNELKTLEWQHVNLDRAPATITIAAEYAKSRRADTILLPESAADRLMDWRHRKVEELGRSPSPKERVFSISRRLTPQFKKDCDFAGIPLEDEAGRVADFHSLRHTYAQLLVNGGVHPRVAQTMLRHRDIRTTMKIYVRDDLAAQVAALGVLPTFGGGAEVQHIVQHAGREAGPASATEGKAVQESGIRKSRDSKTWGGDMQQAAAQGDGLHLVAGAGFEPAIFRL
ncbi:tyrosine-type recombinase/integrase [Planctomycetota bacterium]